MQRYSYTVSTLFLFILQNLTYPIGFLLNHGENGNYNNSTAEYLKILKPVEVVF